MSHEAATREALARYIDETPNGGVLADQLARTARATLSLYDQAITTPGTRTTWADHNLAVIVSAGLDDPALKACATTLFRGTRRRLAAALEAEPDDLAPATALALGAATSIDDPRLVEDIGLVAGAVTKTHAGPRLIRAAVTMVVEALETKDAGIRKASFTALSAVQESAERLAGRLPNHPDIFLDRARLALHRSHGEEGVA